MLLQFLRCHPVDPRRSPVAFYHRQSQRTVLVRYHFFDQPLVHRSLLEGLRTGVLSPSPLARHGFTASASGTLAVATVVVALLEIAGRDLRSQPCEAELLLSDLAKEISPGKVQNLSPRAVRLYLMRLDDLWSSLFIASLPPAPGLTGSSCSYGREFATRFFRLRLAVTPCVSLRLPSSAPIGSFHPTGFCPCWAHYATLVAFLRAKTNATEVAYTGALVKMERPTPNRSSADYAASR